MDKFVFNEIIGHFPIQTKILNSIKGDRLPHAYLFYGNEGAGKEAFSIELAKLLNCEKGPLYLCQNCPTCLKIGHFQHPDIKFIIPTPSKTNIKPEEIINILSEKAENIYKRINFPSKSTFISIDTIRELKYEAKFKLYEGKKKIFIISEADKMRPEAANALLKILEEPPENLMLILITGRIYQILPTIKSRCQLIHFPPYKGDEILKILKKYLPDPPSHLSSIIRMSLNNIKLAFDFIQDGIMEKRDQSIEFLRKIVVLDKSHELMSQIEKITATRDRKSMVLLLFFLLSWFRDTYHFQTSPIQANLFNSDLERNIKGFVQGYPRADYVNIIREVETAINNIQDPRNLNPTLILLDLSIKLNKFIKQS